jgi:hypothetical protein
MHNRKLVLSGIALTMARPNPHEIAAAPEVRDELEQIIISSGFLTDAPFKWIGISIRFGLKNDDKPIYQGINKKYGDLSLAIEVDTHGFLEADLDELKYCFAVATLKALIHAGRKYKLPVEALVEHRDKFYS